MSAVSVELFVAIVLLQPTPSGRFTRKCVAVFKHEWSAAEACTMPLLTIRSHITATWIGQNDIEFFSFAQEHILPQKRNLLFSGTGALASVGK